MPEQANNSPVKLPLFSAAQERNGEIEMAGRSLTATSDASLLHETVRMQMANRRCRDRGDQDPRIHLRRRHQAVAAKGYRTRPRGLDALADMASWRHYFRTAAARLFLQDAEEGLGQGAVPGAVGSGARGQGNDRVEALELPELKTKAAKAALDGAGA